MAADYNKAGHPDEERLARARQVMCQHENTERSNYGNHYCVDCGHRVAAPTPTPAPTDANELGPIKLDYATAVGDAKKLNWRKIPLGMGRLNLPMPVDKPYYVAWQEMPWGSTDRRWRVERVEVGALVPALALWWADDLLGLPPCND